MAAEETLGKSDGDDEFFSRGKEHKHVRIVGNRSNRVFDLPPRSHRGNIRPQSSASLRLVRDFYGLAPIALNLRLGELRWTECGDVQWVCEKCLRENTRSLWCRVTAECLHMNACHCSYVVQLIVAKLLLERSIGFSPIVSRPAASFKKPS